MADEQAPPMATPHVAAGVLFTDASGRVLVVEPVYKPTRDLPGGYVEPGESPREAAVREVHEELGIDPPVRDLLVVDWAPNPGEGDKLLFVFDGGQLGPEHETQIQVPANELAGYEYVDAHDLDDLMPARLSRRIQLALTARTLGQTLYAEHGQLDRSLAS